MTDTDEPAGAGGRAAQRRRTRKAIVEAAAHLVAAGAEPSIAEVAKAADVSRRTVYMYFPNVDQLLLDATIGAMNLGVDDVLGTLTEPDVRVRVTRLVDAIFETIETTLPLGRKLIKLTVDTPRTDGMAPRGYRRIRWIEQAVAPARPQLTPAAFDRLVSMLAMIIGWEAFIVLFDVRGLTRPEARETCLAAAGAVLDAALKESDH